ncbi:hypothetical protein D8I35_05265 [Corticibacter populi]|uniref:Uncharacterized protein n=1 Tax=Corticibacter populi TaxID=1550736 RepID=A0A3M6QZT1_9BURK|nr:hypothetical protein [Corticibacter populi]RMX08488.1 hypothetical protein D8I35_05265 [Corticibacter populi]RZS35801.1 hypothetical protein EV687_0880 [Corticibacter populi]
MANTRLMPLAGINNRSEDDAALVRGGDDPTVFVREALNFDITDTGRLHMRGQVKMVTSTPYKHLWYSHLHGDLFGMLGTAWVKIDPDDWSCVELADLGGGWASHCVLNGRVAVAGVDGIFTFDGQAATRLPIETPGMPALVRTGGALESGDYGVAISWLRGSLESSVSEVAYAALQDGGGLTVGMPYSIDPSITMARLYMTKPGSRVLLHAGDHAVNGDSVDIVAMPLLGGAPEFQHLDAMPAGRFLGHWKGRLVTATNRVLSFSHPMAWHLHDRRHDFVQFPQRITFVVAVEGGLWVGQVDHVLFLSGSQPDDLQVLRRGAKAPVYGSAILLDAELLGEVAGGSQAALWLAENGYVIGTADGQVVEIHRKSIAGIRASAGASTVWGERILTVLG